MGLLLLLIRERDRSVNQLAVRVDALNKRITEVQAELNSVRLAPDSNVARAICSKVRTRCCRWSHYSRGACVARFPGNTSLCMNRVLPHKRVGLLQELMWDDQKSSAPLDDMPGCVAAEACTRFWFHVKACTQACPAVEHLPSL